MVASGGQALEPSWVRGPRNAVRRDLCEWPQALPLSDPHASCGDPGTTPHVQDKGLLNLWFSQREESP